MNNIEESKNIPQEQHIWPKIDKKVAIIGADSYLGAYITYFLLEQGYSVVAIVENNIEHYTSHLISFKEVLEDKERLSIREVKFPSITKLQVNIYRKFVYIYFANFV